MTARRYVVETYGEGALRDLLGVVSPPVRAALNEPLASHWYPEAVLQESFEGARRVLAGGDPDRMIAFFEGCTLVGINAFWRTALRLTSGRFALRGLPVSWRHMRRGQGSLEVELDGAIGRVHYLDFPYFDDPNYRLLVLGTVGPLLRVATGSDVPITIARFTSSSLTAQVRLPG